MTSRKSRPSSYSRFNYPVKFHSSERRESLSCDVPDCLRRPSSGVYWRMPVRQGPPRPATRSQSPAGTAERSGSLSGDEQTSSAVVIEVERSEAGGKKSTESKPERDSPPPAAERTETPSCQVLTKSISRTVVIEVEGDDKGLTDHDEQEEGTSAEVEVSHDRTEGVDGYDDDDFEEEEEEEDEKENDSVTSTGN